MHDGRFNHGQRGEFRGDFTRDTFDPLRHFSRVLMQQGRVQLDADWNEQVSIFTHYLKTLTCDVGSEHWGPHDDSVRGFNISINHEGTDLLISPGHYYVGGNLCESNGNTPVFYSNQPDFQPEEKDKFLMPANAQNILVYLDVWERHLTYVEDDYMREAALGGVDTASRAKIVWQVKLKYLGKDEFPDFQKDYKAFLGELGSAIKLGSGMLRARAGKAGTSNSPCLISPEARYRGAENQLYRVEIHHGGSSGNISFKWSRENGSVIFPVKELSDKVLTLEHLGRNTGSGLKPNDWVEILDDDYVLQNHVAPLLQVVDVDHENLQVRLNASTTFSNANGKKHPYLRRWDQREGDSTGISVVASSNIAGKGWLTLEDGVEVQFLRGDDNQEYVYNSGDYWLIPARTKTGDVEWPGPSENPMPLKPHGVVHYYAPLALIHSEKKTTDLRRKLKKIWS